MLLLKHEAKSFLASSELLTVCQLPLASLHLLMHPPNLNFPSSRGFLPVCLCLFAVLLLLSYQTTSHTGLGTYPTTV